MTIFTFRKITGAAMGRLYHRKIKSVKQETSKEVQVRDADEVSKVVMVMGIKSGQVFDTC